jgi:hypothetical protein
MSITWRTLHVPSEDGPPTTPNAIVTERNGGTFRLHVLHSRRQAEDLFATEPWASEEDLVYVRARMERSVLPRESPSQPYRLEGDAARESCRFVLTIPDPPLSVLRSYLSRTPGGIVDVVELDANPYAFLLAAGEGIAPQLHVCHSRSQMADALRSLCGRLQGESRQEFERMRRESGRLPLPRYSRRAAFRADGYAGLHLVAAAAGVMLHGVRNDSVDALFD